MVALMTLAVLATAGCGDDASSSSTPDAAERDADPGTGDDAMRPIDARESPDADPNAPDGGPRSCGGLTGQPCGTKEFCDFPDDMCGANDGTGTCKPRPELCQPAEIPVCGCDGAMHRTACEAQQAGTDVSLDTPPC